MSEDTLPELPEKVQGWIGKNLEDDQGEYDIERGYLLNTLSVTENANPLYWDTDVAKKIAGAVIAPPTMLSVWTRPHHWAPGRKEEKLPLAVHFMMKKELDLPEAIIAKNVIKFGAPVKMGDSIRSEQTLVSVSDPKRLKLGLGRFWVISVAYYNQDDEWVGTESYDCFGYRRD
jgi:acyl dehydratase